MTVEEVADAVGSGDGLTMAQAAGLFPPVRNGRPCHPATVSRWCTAGVKLPDGRTVWMASVRIGGRLLTTRAAVRAFVRDCQPVRDAVKPAPQPSKRDAALDRELAELGV